MGKRSFEFSRGTLVTWESVRSAIQTRVVWPPRYFFHPGCHWKNGRYARCAPSGEKAASVPEGSGSSVGKPPFVERVKSLGRSRTELRIELKSTDLPSGVQQTAMSGPGWYVSLRASPPAAAT